MGIVSGSSRSLRLKMLARSRTVRSRTVRIVLAGRSQLACKMLARAPNGVKDYVDNAGERGFSWRLKMLASAFLTARDCVCCDSMKLSRQEAIRRYWEAEDS